MTRLPQHAFGKRTQKPMPQSAAAGSPAQQGRIDWPLVALVTAVFVAGFVWLF